MVLEEGGKFLRKGATFVATTPTVKRNRVRGSGEGRVRIEKPGSCPEVDQRNVDEKQRVPLREAVLDERKHDNNQEVV